MGAAFNAALDALPDTPDQARADWIRDTLAMRIIEKAQSGERDITRLRDDALAYLANLTVQK